MPGLLQRILVSVLSSMQADFRRRGHEQPKRCKTCLIAKKASLRFAGYNMPTLRISLIIGGLEKSVPWYVRRCQPFGVRSSSGALQDATGTAVGLTVPDGIVNQCKFTPNRHAGVVRCSSPVSSSSASSPRDRLAAVLRRWNFAEGYFEADYHAGLMPKTARYIIPRAGVARGEE